tara:strand:- start:570 stop:1235 length:666 start_codon:yes stop_codon:yes gene_type:complete
LLESSLSLSNLADSKITAVIIIDDIDNAGPLCDALLSGGINSVELTLRTDIAFDAINFITKRFPEMLVGAGTVLTSDQLEKSIQSGASFAVAPGLDPKLVEKANGFGFPFAPGICTPSELQIAITLQCKVLKFFPSEPMGGIKYLQSMAAPFTHLNIKYIPLGGIDFDTVSDYLNSELVLCIGGSWIAKRKMIIDNKWKQIEQNSRKVRKIIKMNKKDTDE